MKFLLVTAMILAASGANAAEYCLVKKKGGWAQHCYSTLGVCESKADRMNGWTCEKR